MLTLFAIAGALFCVNGATAQSTPEGTRYGEFKNTCCVMKQAKLTFDVRSGSKQTEILSYHIVTAILTALTGFPNLTGFLNEFESLIVN